MTLLERDKEKFQEGMEQGIEQGEQKKALEIAEKLLKQGFDIETIIEMTGVSVEKLKNM